jgi:hypothetical protein
LCIRDRIEAAPKLRGAVASAASTAPAGAAAEASSGEASQ